MEKRAKPPMKAKWWRNELKVGLMVIVALVLLSFLLITAARWQPNIRSKEIRIRFDYVAGLLKNAPVNMHGMEIGKVKSVNLMGDWVEVKAQIDKEISIREGYRIIIDTIGIVGEKYVEIINGPIRNPETKDNPLQGDSPASISHILVKASEIAGETVKTLSLVQKLINTNEGEIRSRIAELKDFVLETRNALGKTIGRADILLDRINRMTQGKEKDVSETITELKHLVDELNKDRGRLVPVIQSVAGDIEKMIDRTEPTVEGSLNDLKKASGDLRSLAEKVNQYIEDLNKSLSGLVAQLGEIAGATDQKLQKGLDDLSRSSVELNNVLDRVDKLVSVVENGHGTLGKLIKDEDSVNLLTETVSTGKNAIENINSVASNLNQKLKFFDGISTRKEYELSYNESSRSLQNQLMLSISSGNPYFYTVGLSVREDDVMHNLQVGRKFGGISARAGSIRSKAGVGFDYWPVSDRVGISLEGVDRNKKRPQIDFKTAVKLYRNLYFVFGAEDLAGSSDTELNFGFRAVFK